MACDDGGWEPTSLDTHLLVCRAALYLERELNYIQKSRLVYLSTLYDLFHWA